MKKRALITLLLTFLLVAPHIVSVKAATVDVNPVDVNIQTGIITISGKSNEVNKSMAILVLNPNAGIDDLVAHPEYIQNQREIYSDSNGNFSYQFELYLDNVDDTGDYLVYINGKMVKSFYYATAENRIGIIQDIIDASDSELTVMLNTEDVLKLFSVNEFRPISLIDKAKLAETANPLIKAKNLDSSDAGSASVIQSVLKECAVLELFNQGMQNECFDANGQFIYNNIINLSGLDAKYSVSLYNSYNNILSDNGKVLVKNSLFNKSYNDKETFEKDFLVQITLKGIKNSKQIGYGHISSLLTVQNMAFLGLTGNITDNVARKLVEYSGEYTSIDVLQQKINEFSTITDNTDNNHHPSSTGGGSFSVTTGANKPQITPPPVEQESSFDDINGVEWAKNAIEYLYKKGIVNGVEAKKFEPDSLVTREQFVKMTCIALDINGESNESFTDVENDSWYAPYVVRGVGAGIIKGTGDNLFGTGTFISRQDVAVILYRTMEKANSDVAPLDDIDQVDDYAKDAVNALRSMKIINGFEDNTFRPAENCTRAQAATIIYNFLSANSKVEE